MTKTQRHTGLLCWMDVPADDMDRAKKFYGDVFGWSFQDDPEASMSMIQGIGPMSPPEGSQMWGSLSPRMSPHDHITSYFLVPTVDEWAEKVKTHGGEVLRPRVEIPPHGCFAVCKDTEGNTFAIWESFQA